ncbi:hypothetical protein DF135_37585 [Burkholderia cepacia]|nr:hypothetical protein DF135_37585 [Burkholderia cepacia]
MGGKVSGYRSAAGGRRCRPARCRLLFTGKRQVATGLRLPAYGLRQPATSNRQPATGNRQPATGAQSAHRFSPVTRRHFGER